MTIKEFTERTGFYPTYEHYKFIEKSYMDFDGDKDAFCEAYKGNVNSIAEIIARSADADLNKEFDSRDKLIDELKNQAVGLKSDIIYLNEQIEELEEQLDKELDWKPCKNAGTQMTQTDYQNLAADKFVKSMTDEEAANFIAEELGFDPKKVKIIPTVETFESNKYHRMRVAVRYKREPLYSSTDWNYVRFDVNGIEYEYINGQIVMYCR